MAVSRFSVPGHSTRRDFSVYVVVAKARARAKVRLYVGKTGDNRDGCNPVISRAGNHFSYNEVHSQVRNKLGAPSPDFDFEYFYVSLGTYGGNAANRRRMVNVTNEIERQTNLLLQTRLPEDSRIVLMNPLKNSRWIPPQERRARAQLVTSTTRTLFTRLVSKALKYAKDLLPAAG